MRVIRYSNAFKMQAVREVETGETSAEAVQRKHSIKGKGTVIRWVRQYGSGKYGLIRVEKADEDNEAARLPVRYSDVRPIPMPLLICNGLSKPLGIKILAEP